MRLELDLDPGDWEDYKTAQLGDLKRVGVVVPGQPVGISHFVRLGVHTDDGQAVVVMTPWLIWKAATRALTERLGEDQAPAPAPEPSGLLTVIEAAMNQHEHHWGLGPDHADGTDAEAWRDDAGESRHMATDAAMRGELTWAHTLLEAVHAAMAAEEPAELCEALARVTGAAANWMNILKERS